jgi:hypothetical protein
VGNREKENQNDVVAYYRKHGHMLEAFFESWGKSKNIKATLQPNWKRIESLTKDHHAAVDTRVTAVSAPGPLPPHGPNSVTTDNRDHSNMVPAVPLNMSNATVLTSQTNGPLVFHGHLQQFDKTKTRKMDRAPQVCSTCGHFRHHNILHNKKRLQECWVKMITIVIEIYKVGVPVLNVPLVQQMLDMINL